MAVFDGQGKTMRISNLKLRQRGLSLIEALLVLGILSVVILVFIVAQSKEFENKKAEQAGKQIALIGNAVDSYIVNNYGYLSTSTITSLTAANPNGPLTCYAGGGQNYSCVLTMGTLENWGYLPNWITTTDPYGSPYNIVLERDVVAGVTIINAAVVSSNPLTIGTGAPRYDLLGEALRAAGAQGGITPAATPTTLSGYAGAYQLTNASFPSLPAASQPFTVSGQLGYYSGFGAQQYSAYVRRDGTLYMTGDEDYGERDIVNVRGINGSELSPGQFDPRGNPPSVIRMGTMIVDPSQSAFPAYGTAFTPELKTGPGVPTDLYGNTTVYNPGGGILAQVSTAGIDLRAGIFNTTPVQSNAYADTTGNSMAQFLTAIDANSGITNRAGDLYLTAATSKVAINGDVTVGKDGSGNPTTHNLVVNGTITAQNSVPGGSVTLPTLSTTPGVGNFTDIFLSNNCVNNNPGCDSSGGGGAAVTPNANLEKIPLSFLSSRLVLKEIYKVSIPSSTPGGTVYNLVPKPNCHADALPSGVSYKATVFVYPVQESIQGPVISSVPPGATEVEGNLQTFYEAVAADPSPANDNGTWTVSFNNYVYNSSTNSNSVVNYPGTGNNYPPTPITAFAQTYCSYF